MKMEPSQTKATGAFACLPLRVSLVCCWVYVVFWGGARAGCCVLFLHWAEGRKKGRKEGETEGGKEGVAVK